MFKCCGYILILLLLSSLAASAAQRTTIPPMAAAPVLDGAVELFVGWKAVTYQVIVNAKNAMLDAKGSDK